MDAERLVVPGIGENAFGQLQLQLNKVQTRIDEIKNQQVAGGNAVIPDDWMLNLEPSIKRLREKERLNQHDYLQYQFKPIIFDAKEAHETGKVAYDENGVCSLSLPEFGIDEKIAMDHQFPDNIRVTFDSLEKALSPLAGAKAVTISGNEEKPLYELLQKEREKMEDAQSEAYADGKWAADYGNYVFDVREKKLFLEAPEFWKRLSLVTSTSTLFSDPDMEFSWWEARQIMENSVIGVIGASVGGNIWEGYNRDNRPIFSKIADFDAIESGNFNRLMGMRSMGDLSQSRAAKSDPKSPFDFRGNRKCDVAAYNNHMNDPYTKTFVFNEGINSENILEFLLGDGFGQPPINMLVEEVDDFDLKVQARQLCRLLGIPMMMVSDFGQKTQMQFYDFAKNPDMSLGYHISDDDLYVAWVRANHGVRSDRINFIEAMCGPYFRINNARFTLWAEGTGEQMSASLPQSGATALDTGGSGGREITKFLLGHEIPANFVFNHLTNKIEAEEWDNAINV